MDVNLVDRLNKIMALAANNEKRQRSYVEKFNDYEKKCNEDLKSLKEELVSIQQQEEDLHEAIDEFAQIFEEFREKLYTPPGSPSRMEESQDPYGDIKSTQEIEEELKRQNVLLTQGHSQASYNSGDLQPKVSENRGIELQASQLLPPSGIKHQKAQEGISLRPNYTVNPKTFTAGESSSQSAKERFFTQKRKVTFVVGETEFPPWEKDYADFSKLVYELNQGECFLKIGEKQNIYPRFTCISGASQNFVKKLADFGYLDCLYPSKDLKEIKAFPEDFKIVVKDFANGEAIYLRFYSISHELDSQTIFPTYHLIITGFVTSVQLRASDQDFKVPFFNKK